MASANLLNSMNYDMTAMQAEKSGFNPLDIIKGTGYTIGGVATSAVTSFVNTGISLANLVKEDDYEYVDTGEWVNAWMGGGAEDFYEDHSTLIELGGLVAGSLIPGGLATKALRTMQPKVSKGLSAFAAGNETKFGSMASGLGKVIMPEKALTNLTTAIRKGNHDSLRFKEYYSLGKQSLHQNMLESFVYETATVLTMAKNSTLSNEDLDYFDSVKSNMDSVLFGTAIGGAFGGLAGMAGAVSKAKKSLRAVHEELNPYAVTSFNYADSSLVGDKVADISNTASNIEKNVVALTDEIKLLEQADELDDIAISLTKKKLALAQGAAGQAKNRMDEQLSKLVTDKGLQQDAFNLFKQMKSTDVYDTVAGARKLGPIPTRGIVPDPVVSFAISFDPKVAKSTFGGQLTKRDRILEMDKETLFNMDDDEVMQVFNSGYANVKAKDAMAVIKKTKMGSALDSDLANFRKTEYNGLIQNQTDIFVKMDSIKAMDPNLSDESIEAIESLAAQADSISSTLGRLERPEEMMRKMFSLFTDVSESGAVTKLEELRKLYPTVTKSFEKSGGLRKLFGPINAVLDMEKGVALREVSVVPTARDLGEVAIKGNNISVAGGSKNYELKSAIPVTSMDNIEATARYSVAETDPHLLLKDYYGSTKGTKAIGTYDFPRAYAAMRILKENPQNNKLKFKFTNIDGEDVVIKNTNDFIKEMTKAKRRAVANMKHGMTKTQVARVLDVDESWVTGDYALTGTVPYEKIFRSLPKELKGKTLPQTFQSPKYMRIQYDRSFDNEAFITGKINAEQRMMSETKEARSDMLAYFGDDGQILSTTVKPQKITGVDAGAGLVASDQAEYGLEAAKVYGATLNKRSSKRKVDVKSAYVDEAQELNIIPEGSSTSPAVAELTVMTTLARQQRMYYADNIGDLINREMTRLNPQALSAMMQTQPQLGTQIQEAISHFTGMANKAGMVHKSGIDEVKNLLNTLDAMVPAELTKETVKKFLVDSEDILSSFKRKPDLEKLKDGRKLHYEIENDSVTKFVKKYISRNDEDMDVRRNIAKHRGDMISYEEGTFYVPPIDTSKYSHVATVKFFDESKVYGSKNMGVIVANNQKDLLAKVQKAKEALGGEDKVIIRALETQEDRFKALGNYEADLAITDNVVESTMNNKGVLWDVSEEYNDNIVANYLNGEIRRGDNLDRAAIGVLASKQIDELRGMEKVYNPKGAINTGDRKADLEVWGKQIKTMMNVHHHGNYEGYISAQQKVADGFVTAMGTVKTLFSRANPDKLGEEFTQIDKYLERAGMPRPYSEAKDYLKLNTNLPVQNLDGIISALNGAAATVMLRLDSTQAIVNAMSMPIMLTPEMQKLKQYVKGENLKQLEALTNTTVQKGVREPTNMKLAMGAVQEFFTGNKTKSRKELIEAFRQKGIVKNSLHEMQDAMDGLGVSPNMTEGTVKQAIKAIKGAGDLLAKPADFSEEFVKYVAGRSAQKILELADGIPEEDKWAIIRNFVDKVHGNYTASQRPTLFKGFAGQAVGLFQTYQFNLYQRMFHHLGEDSKKMAMTMIGTQAGLFGAQSLPGFQLLNDHVAKQSENYNNIYSVAKSEMGDDLSEWFIYGTGSNMFKPFPGMGGLDLYSRGDLTPRTPILLPTSLDEIPVVSMTKKAVTSFLSTMQKSMGAIGAGEPESIGTIFMEGLAHNGLNRPLAGLSQMALDYRTTNQGKLLMTYGNSENKAWTWATKALGAKTMDEAVAVNQYYKSLKYRTHRYENLDRLGRTFRDIIRSNEGTVTGEYEHFRREYVAGGGQAQNFKRWMQNQVAGANDSIINELRNSNTTPEGKYLQSVLGSDVNEF